MLKSTAGESRKRASVRVAVGAAALVGGAAVAGGVLAELRHRRALRSDPQWALLRSPVIGDPVSVVSGDGTRLHAEVFSPDGEAPTVVLIPGWTEELQVFDPTIRELLDRGFRVVSYDLRGQGSSDCTRELDQRIERYGEDLAAVLAATCPGRDDVIVAGHSMGGMALAAWAASFDVHASARAVAFIDTGMSELAAGLALLPVAVPLPVRQEIMTPLLLGDTPIPAISTPVSRTLLRHLAFGPDATAAQVAFVEQMVWRMDDRLRAGAARTMQSLDLAAALERVDVPALVIVGELDRLTPPDQARRIVAALPQVAEFVVLPRTGHMVQLERPGELCDALVRLAESVGLAPSVGVAAGGSA